MKINKKTKNPKKNNIPKDKDLDQRINKYQKWSKRNITNKH